jgi:hypothetical protein
MLGLVYNRALMFVNFAKYFGAIANHAEHRHIINTVTNRAEHWGCKKLSPI